MTTVRTLHTVPMLSASEALEALLRRIPCPRVQAELRRGYEAALAANLLASLTPGELTLCLKHLPDLFLILYTEVTERSERSRP